MLHLLAEEEENRKVFFLFFVYRHWKFHILKRKKRCRNARSSGLESKMGIF